MPDAPEISPVPLPRRGFVRAVGAWTLAAAAAFIGAAPFLAPWSWPADLIASWVHLAAPAAALGACALCRFRRSSIPPLAAALLGLLLAAGAVLRGSPRAAHAEADGPEVRLLVVNAWSQNPTPGKVLETLERLAPDVAVLVDCPPDIITAGTGGTGVFAPFSTRERRWPDDPRNGWCFVLSRAASPRLDVPGARWTQGDNPFPIAVRAATPAGAIAVVGVHAASPRTLIRWRSGNQTVRDAVEAARAAREVGLPVVVAGDLNSGPTGARDGLLRAAGLRRAGPSFPAMGTYPASLPRAFRIAIDDAWISDELAVVGWELVRGTGSDHAGVVIRLARRGRAPAPD